MKVIRNKGEDLEALLREQKIGDDVIYDSVSNYEIVRVPNGYIYRNEYCGLVFVPEFADKVGAIKNSVAKTEPKKTITK